MPRLRYLAPQPFEEQEPDPPFGVRGGFASPAGNPFGVQQPRLRLPDFGLDETRYNQAMEFADQTDQIDQMAGNVDPPAQPRGFWAKLAAYAPDAIARGFASQLNPQRGGAEQFLSGLGSGFVDQRQQQAQSRAERRQAELEAYKMKGDLFDRQMKQRQLDIMARPKPLGPDYQKIEGLDASGHPTIRFYDPIYGQSRDTGLIPIPKPLAPGAVPRPISEKDSITGVITYRDPITGAPRFTGRVSPKETSVAERTAAGQTVQLELANRELESVPPPKGLMTKILQRRQMMGESYNWESAAADDFYSPDERRFLASAIAFGGLSGYIQSGKVLNETELQRVFNVIPTANDDPKTVDFKRKMRRTLIDQGRLTAGRAYTGGTPDDDSTDEDGNPY